MLLVLGKCNYQVWQLIFGEDYIFSFFFFYFFGQRSKWSWRLFHSCGFARTRKCCDGSHSRKMYLLRLEFLQLLRSFSFTPHTVTPPCVCWLQLCQVLGYKCAVLHVSWTIFFQRLYSSSCAWSLSAFLGHAGPISSFCLWGNWGNVSDVSTAVAEELKCSGGWVFLKGGGTFIIDLQWFLIF